MLSNVPKDPQIHSIRRYIWGLNAYWVHNHAPLGSFSINYNYFGYVWRMGDVYRYMRIFFFIYSAQAECSAKTLMLSETLNFSSVSCWIFRLDIRIQHHIE